MLLRLLPLILLLSLCCSCNEDSTTVKSSAYGDLCPANFSLVSKSYYFGSPAFCLSQDLMAFDTKARLIVRSNTLTAAIVEVSEAEKLCQGLGPNYDLITLGEYQMAAREVELIDENWSGGRVGLGSLGKEKKFSRLFSGETVDGNGNINRGGGQDASSTWTKDSLTSYATLGYNLDSKAAEFYLSEKPLVSANSPYDDLLKWFAPKGDYRNLIDLASGAGGLGVIHLNSGTGTIVRGPLTGATFAAEFKQSLSATIGFHCVYRP